MKIEVAVKPVFVKITSAVLGMCWIGQVASEPIVYTPDKWHTRILFSVDHMGLSNYAGRFSGHDFKLVLDEDDIANSTVEVTVPVSSIDTFSPELNNKISGKMFFDADTHPNMHFKSTKVEKTGANTGRMTGDLTIKGKTLPAVFDFTINGKVMHERFHLNNIGFTAMGTVDSRAYGVNNLPVWMVGSIVNVRIELEAFEGEKVPYYMD
jgi:polyisoprenoid-binding protein YceI